MNNENKDQNDKKIEPMNSKVEDVSKIRQEPSEDDKARLERQILEQKLVEKNLESERLERERIEKEMQQKRWDEIEIVNDNLLLVIPSWGDLTGHPTLGKYANQDVKKIHSDVVVFLVRSECAIKTKDGTFYCIFGLGNYYTKFELQEGRYIIDTKPLTGLILTDFVYEYMLSSRDVALENDPEVTFKENVIKIPMNLSYKLASELTFIRGILMRNLFIHHKDVILDFFDRINKRDGFKHKDEGHKILSTHWDYFDQILVSNKLKDKQEDKYVNSTAGIDNITFGVDEFLQKTFSPDQIQRIEDDISYMLAIYTFFTFDPIDLFSIIENASNLLKVTSEKEMGLKTEIFDKTSVRDWILTCAKSRNEMPVEWPEKFKRKEVKKVEPATSYKETHAKFMQTQDIDISQMPKTYEKMGDDIDKFELRTKKSEFAENKKLPPAPEGNIEDIFLYLKYVIEENYEMQAIGKAFDMARDSLRKMVLQSDSMWEMSKYANIYQKKPPNLSLPLRDENEIIDKIDGWLFEIEEEKRKEREKLEKEKLERERIERERLEKERLEKERLERERLEREKIEKERIEKERLEKERFEQERLEKERIEKDRLENVRLESERIKQERLERESIEKEKMVEERIEKEKVENERQKQLDLEQTQREIEQIRQKRREKEKEWKLQAKKEKKLQKERLKLEKKKKKEEKKLKKFD